VTLFDDGRSDAEVVDALERVGLDALAGGGDRPVELGAGGAGLSAGEAQLLALARVWLRDPDLVVLDEATARVDPETERAPRSRRGRADARPHDARDRPSAVHAAARSTRSSCSTGGRIVEHGDRVDLVGDDDSRFATSAGDRPRRRNVGGGPPTVEVTIVTIGLDLVITGPTRPLATRRSGDDR
jgi:ATP-binding cassette, subfamily B, bacterial